ncbi:MAG: hypothetical protein H5T59_03595, partial [Anaerolineae bacterium]|nr:hypothetical protein [Anaerolineae bacterium]
CGLGLWAKLLFAWALVAAAGAWLVLALARRRPLLPRRDSLGLALAALAFAVPLVPIALFNWQTSGTFLTVARNLGRSYYGVDNLAFGANLATRLGQFRDVLAGTPFWYLGGTFANPWWPLSLALAAAAAVGLAVDRRQSATARVLFPYVVLVFILVQSCFTVSALWHSHLVVALPLAPLALAGTLDALGRVPRRRQWGAILAGVAVAFLALWDLGVDVQYHRALARTGGLGGHTAAIYRLAEVLQGAPHPQPLALDWGIAAPVEFLTQGQVRPLEVFGYESLDRPDANFAARMRPLLHDPTRWHVFHTPEETIYQGRLEAYQTLLAEEGLEGQVVAAVHDPSGRMVFVVGRAVPASDVP